MIKIYAKITAFCLAAVIAGCAATTSPHRDLNDYLHYTEDMSKDYDVDEEWWKAYNDPQLNRLIELALTNNTDLAQSALNINRALYQTRLANADFYPTPSASLGASTNKDLTRGDDFVNSFSGEIGLSYELDLWQRISDAASAQEWEYRATVLDRETVRLSLINSIIEVYYNLAYLNSSVEATRENLQNYEDIYNLVSFKHDVGKIDSLQERQAHQSMLATRNNLLELNTQMRNAEQALKNLLNLTPEDNLYLVYPDILEVRPIPVDLDVPLAVLAERPDLKASEYRLERSFKNLSADRKSWYPSVSLNTAIRSSADDIGQTFNFPILVGSISISLPFLDWNRVQNNIRISETDYELALLDFENTVNTALNELAYYYYAYLNSLDVALNAEARYEDTVRITEYYRIRYDTGKNELSDLLDAISSENSSRLDVLNNNYQILLNENMIFRSMAGRYTSLY